MPKWNLGDCNFARENCSHWEKHESSQKWFEKGGEKWIFFGGNVLFWSGMECIFSSLSPGENEMENNNPKKCNAHTQSARKHTYALWAILKILQVDV